MGGHTLKPATDKSDEDTAAICQLGVGSNPGTVVVADELLSQLNLQPYSSSLLVNYKQGMDTTEADESIKHTLLDNLLVDGKEPGSWGIFITRSEMYTQAAQMNGLISYLAIYIGFVLVVHARRFCRSSNSPTWPTAAAAIVCWHRSAATTARSAIR